MFINIPTLSLPVNEKLNAPFISQELNNFNSCSNFFHEVKKVSSFVSGNLFYDRWQKLQESSLGIYTKSCKQEEACEVTEGNKKYKKQDVARSLVGGRLCQCCRTPIVPHEEGKTMSNTPQYVDVYKSKTSNKFSFGGLMKCGSVWMCPVCASEITEVRRIELKQGVENWIASGHGVSMLTVTVPHYAKNGLENVLDGITDAYRRFTNRKGFKEFCQGNQVVGRIRTLEVTYGENGWHPHFHILLFTENDVSLVVYKNNLLPHWQSACISSGLPCPNEYGLDLVNGMQAAAYVSKWGIEEEMTKGHLKQGKKDGHVSPFGLLDLYEAGDAVAGEKFKEFAECFKGKRQLVWSKGLREKLGLGEGKTDQEIAEEVLPSSEIFARIPVRTWKVITDKNKVCELLAVCGKGKDFLDAWLQRITDFEDLKRGHARNNLSQADFKI